MVKTLNALWLALLLTAGNAGAQAQQQQAPRIIMPPPMHTPPHAAQRYEIDQKRNGVSMASEEAMHSAREFIRLDSSYYVGHMMQGIYMANERANDYLGYKQSEEPLERALHDLERDYKQELSTRTHDVMTYIGMYQKQIDYAIIVDCLNRCYQNTEEPLKSYALLRRYARWHFQREFFDVWNSFSWLIHRNRFYTSDKYPFLKNSIDENEALANRYLDTSILKLRQAEQFNIGVFKPGYDDNDYLGVYHYRAVLYSYQIAIDSAEKYFNKMRNTAVFPHNNYANWCGVQAKWHEAETEYKEASMQDASDKRLQEWAYYGSIVNIYKAQPKLGEAALRDMIKAAGSTPGYGWYNIALARCLYYDGQMEFDKDEQERVLNKAAQFQELHIGTTLGQSQYTFSISLQQLLHKEAEYEAQRFEHGNYNWAYKAFVMYPRMGSIQGQQYLQQFAIINQFAQNPERDRVIYKLFSSESTVSWDEIWFLIRDFSTNYFLANFQQQLTTDKRERVQKYFRFFIARLKMKQGDYKEARTMLTGVLTDKFLDPVYEKLLIARTYQALAECNDELDNKAEGDEDRYHLFQTYPQLFPYTGLRANMALHVTGEDDKDAAEAVTALKACNINWTTAGPTAPQAFLRFFKTGNTKEVEYYVIDNSGNTIVPRQTVSYKDPEAFGRSGLSYRLFNIGGLNPAATTNEVADK